MDEAAWGALALALSLLGGVYTWQAYRRRGVAAGMRGAGLTLLPIAAWLTDTLRLLTRIGDAVGDWATRLVFSPSTWAGLVVAGVAVVLLVVSGFLERRGLGAGRRNEDDGGLGRRSSKAVAEPSPRSQGSTSQVDDEMAEIEAILRKRGIS